LVDKKDEGMMIRVLAWTIVLSVLPFLFFFFPGILGGGAGFEHAMLSFRFDDCYESQLKAYNVLEENNMTATFYCITSMIGKQGYMNWDDLERIRSDGFEIGSHSKTHTNLLFLAPRRAMEEVGGSKALLESHGVSVKSFAYPYGIINPFLLGVVRRHYECASTYPLFRGSLNYKTTRRYALGCETIRSSEEFRNALERAVKRKAWLVACFHRVGEGEGRFYVKEDELVRMVRVAEEYADKGLIRVVSLREGCSLLE